MDHHPSFSPPPTSPPLTSLTRSFVYPSDAYTSPAIHSHSPSSSILLKRKNPSRISPSPIPPPSSIIPVNSSSNILLSIQPRTTRESIELVPSIPNTTRNNSNQLVLPSINSARQRNSYTVKTLQKQFRKLPSATNTTATTPENSKANKKKLKKSHLDSDSIENLRIYNKQISCEVNASLDDSSGYGYYLSEYSHPTSNTRASSLSSSIEPSPTTQQVVSPHQLPKYSMHPNHQHHYHLHHLNSSNQSPSPRVSISQLGKYKASWVQSSPNSPREIVAEIIKLNENFSTLQSLKSASQNKQNPRHRNQPVKNPNRSVKSYRVSHQDQINSALQRCYLRGTAFPIQPPISQDSAVLSQERQSTRANQLTSNSPNKLALPYNSVEERNAADHNLLPAITDLKHGQMIRNHPPALSRKIGRRKDQQDTPVSSSELIESQDNSNNSNTENGLVRFFRNFHHHRMNKHLSKDNSFSVSDSERQNAWDLSAGDNTSNMSYSRNSPYTPFRMTPLLHSSDLGGYSQPITYDPILIDFT